MKLYTKMGDHGKTGLPNGVTVDKDDIRVEAYGTLDELNAHLGWLAGMDEADGERGMIERIQNLLFLLGGELASSGTGRLEKLEKISTAHVQWLETQIDRLDGKLPPLQNFILPGGNQAAALCHVARTICRRAERTMSSLAKTQKINSQPLVFINRLSDLLFVLARFINKGLNVNEKKVDIDL
jgi:cob(I)alamin adenosyltransferase